MTNENTNVIEMDKQELITTRKNENGELEVNGRELHGFLEIGTQYTIWFERMADYGFTENIDYVESNEKVSNQKRLRTYEQTNHEMTIDMAKEVSMLQRNEKGKQARRYFLQIEKAWNSPEMIMKRALEFADAKVKALTIENTTLATTIEENQPKVEAYHKLMDSTGHVDMGTFAKHLNIGRNTFYKMLREDEIFMKENNIPQQQYMKYFTVVSKPRKNSFISDSVALLNAKGMGYLTNRYAKINETA